MNLVYQNYKQHKNETNPIKFHKFITQKKINTFK